MSDREYIEKNRELFEAILRLNTLEECGAFSRICSRITRRSP